MTLKDVIIDIDSLLLRLVFDLGAEVSADVQLNDSGSPESISDAIGINWDGKDYVVNGVYDVSPSPACQIVLRITEDTPHVATDPDTFTYLDDYGAVFRTADGLVNLGPVTNKAIITSPTGNPEVTDAVYNALGETLSVTYDQLCDFSAPPSGIFQVRLADGTYRANKYVITSDTQSILFAMGVFPATGQANSTLRTIGAGSFIKSTPAGYPVNDVTDFPVTE